MEDVIINRLSPPLRRPIACPCAAAEEEEEEEGRVSMSCRILRSRICHRRRPLRRHHRLSPALLSICLRMETTAHFRRFHPALIRTPETTTTAAAGMGTHHRLDRATVLPRSRSIIILITIITFTRRCSHRCLIYSISNCISR